VCNAESRLPTLHALFLPRAAAAPATPAGSASGSPGRRLLGRGEGGALTCSKYADWSTGSLSPPTSWDWRAAGGITAVKDQAGVSFTLRSLVSCLVLLLSGTSTV
jgi:hypothetical protein